MDNDLLVTRATQVRFDVRSELSNTVIVVKVRACMSAMLGMLLVRSTPHVDRMGLVL